MSRTVSLFIKDILENMNDALEFIEGISYDQFTADKKTLNAVLRSIEVIGEAAKNIPDEVRAGYPQVPWKEMAGMRGQGNPFLFWSRPRNRLAGHQGPNSGDKTLDTKGVAG